MGNMAVENSLDGDIYTQQTRASTRQTPAVETVKIPENAGNRQDSEKRKATQGISTSTVPFYKLFSFADSWDYLLMLVGTVTAVGNGMCLPAVALLFGELMDAFGKTVNTNNILHEVSKVLCKIDQFNSYS